MPYRLLIVCGSGVSSRSYVLGHWVRYLIPMTVGPRGVKVCYILRGLGPGSVTSSQRERLKSTSFRFLDSSPGAMALMRTRVKA